MRITNLTSGYRLKPSQAQNRIDQCISTWVEHGKSIRDLSLSERVTARSEQAKLESPLPWAELPGLKVENIPHLFEERQLIKEANLFCASAA